MSTDPTKKKDDHVSTSKALDDEQRVKVLSPGMLVAKRFFRNKLAVAGLVILVAMFLFSFIGGMVSPYNESRYSVKQIMYGKTMRELPIINLIFLQQQMVQNFLRRDSRNLFLLQTREMIPLKQMM